VAVVAAAGGQFFSLLRGRGGGGGAVWVPHTQGFFDHLTLPNERDGGINSVTKARGEGGTRYYVDPAVEGFERLKGKGPTGAAVFPMSYTPLVNALIARATHDQIPLLAVGDVRSDAVDGRVFPYVFTPPTTWWSLNTATIRFLGQRVGGMDKLKGLKMAYVYQDNDTGREPIPILDAQATQYGFTVQHLAVPWPGLDQKATWLRVKVAQPDWVLLRAQGAMTPVTLKEAAQVGFPRDKIVGDPASCSEQDLLPAGEVAIGFICAGRWGWGTHFPLIQDILTYVYARGKGAGPEEDVGTFFWNAGMVRALLTAEALRTAMRHFGNQPMTRVQVQWGLEHLTLTAAALKEMGAEGLLPPFTLSCRDHEGGGGVKFRQWDGKQWTVLTDWIAPDQTLVWSLVEASAAKYAQEKGITPRTCP